MAGYTNINVPPVPLSLGSSYEPIDTGISSEFSLGTDNMVNNAISQQAVNVPQNTGGVAGAAGVNVTAGAGGTGTTGGAGGVGAQAAAAANPAWFAKGGIGGFALGAIDTLGNLWSAFQQNKIAKQSLKLQTKAFETNLHNQRKNYNTELEDRIRARYHTEGRSDQADSYIERNKL